jgi:hypothetical protein
VVLYGWLADVDLVPQEHAGTAWHAMPRVYDQAMSSESVVAPRPQNDEMQLTGGEGGAHEVATDVRASY